MEKPFRQYLESTKKIIGSPTVVAILQQPIFMTTLGSFRVLFVFNADWMFEIF